MQAMSDIGWVVGHSFIIYGPLLTPVCPRHAILQYRLAPDDCASQQQPLGSRLRAFADDRNNVHFFDQLAMVTQAFLWHHHRRCPVCGSTRRMYVVFMGVLQFVSLMTVAISILNFR